MLNKDFGHWTVLKEVDINEYIGFVYVVKFENGKKYIGAKKIWKRIKTPPSSFKRGPRLGFEESDWKTYTTSSKLVNALIEENINVEEFVIVGWYKSWGKTLMAEMEMQLANDVLIDDAWLNKQIGGHFNPSCFDDLTQDDISKWMNFEKGNAHVNYPMMYKLGNKTKYVHPNDVEKYTNAGWQMGRSPDEKANTIHIVSKYKIWDCENKLEINIENQNKFARDNNLDSPHMTRLLKGELDFIGNGRYSLLPSIRRQFYKYKEVGSNLYFITDSEVVSHYGLKRNGHVKLLRDKIIEPLIVESKKDYIERLKNIDIIEYVRHVNIIPLMENSFKDFKNSYSEKEFNEIMDWIVKYVDYLKRYKNES